MSDMSKLQEGCDLCGLSFSSSQSENRFALSLSDGERREIFNFLRRRSNANENSTKIQSIDAKEEDGSCTKITLCNLCHKRIKVVSVLRRQVVATGNDVRKSVDESLEEEDIDYEELNALSSFYAENDEDNVIDTKPNSETTLSSKGTNSAKQLRCQLCSASLRRYESLRRHYITIHGYNSASALPEDKHENVAKEKIEAVDTDVQYTCRDCQKKFGNKHCLIRHVLETHAGSENGRLLFTCKNCDKSYRNERDLKAHKERLCPAISLKNTTQHYQISCPICKGSFTASHIAKHHSYAHACRFCAIVCNSRKEKLGHMREEHFSQMEKNSCKECGERFESSSCLKRHAAVAHGRRTIKCPIDRCSHLFLKGSSRLKRHLKNYHSEEEEGRRASYKFECPECYKKIRTKNLLDCHIKAVHNPEGRTVSCAFCNYTIPRRRRHSLKKHIRSKHPEQIDMIRRFDEKRETWKQDMKKRAKIQCLLCNYAGVKISNMRRHYENKHDYDVLKCDAQDVDPGYPDGVLCPECGEHFHSQNILIQHILTHHSKTTGEQCLYCSFRYNDILAHIEDCHMSERSSSIQICKRCVPEQIFSSFEDLLRHTRSYHRKKPDFFIESCQKKGSGISDKTLCENCGKTILATMIARHKSECKGLLQNKQSREDDTSRAIGMESKSKKYVPVHLSGICPYCEHKFSDLLGHIRHGHRKKDRTGNYLWLSTVCSLCSEKFGSVRELVTHRQLHPQFNYHTCQKCKVAKFETIVELRDHRRNTCIKNKNSAKSKTMKIGSADIELSVKKENEPMSGVERLATGTECANDKGLTKDNALKSVSNNVSSVDEDVKPSAAISFGGVKPKQAEYEGRGTVCCHLCQRQFTMKQLLRRHYIASHGYDPNLANTVKDLSTPEQPGASEALNCPLCEQTFASLHARIKHQLDLHATLSGQICPYCPYTRKFDNLDEHVLKYHEFVMQSPVQTCSTCKLNLGSYQELKIHKQLHDGGTKRVVELRSETASEKEATGRNGDVTIHVPASVRAHPEIGNRGGVKCHLCNAFKLRKDNLKIHYIKHHGFNPRAANCKIGDSEGDGASGDSSVEALSCPCCHEMYRATPIGNSRLIAHLLKAHSKPTGLICPYCCSHHPERYLDLQRHVTSKHMDMLTGYNIENVCKVCKEKFRGYAELRDHVQTHGENFREPYGHPEAYREYANKRRRLNGKLIPFQRWKELHLEQRVKEEREVEEPLELKESNAHDASISSTVLDEIIKSCNGGDVRAFEGLLGDDEVKETQSREPLPKDQL